jgi:hypothetical protein
VVVGCARPCRGPRHHHSASATTRGLITGKQIANYSINSKKLVNHTIQKHDLSNTLANSLKGTTGPAGPQGAAGPAGPQGPAGPKGSVSGVTIVNQQFTVPAGDLSIHSVSCPAGTGVLSGGVVSVVDGATWYDAPSANGWAGAADNYYGSTDGYMRVYAVCGTGVPAATVSTLSGAPADKTSMLLGH